LFERHIFHRLTNGHYDADDPDISAPTAGGYGPGGDNQYLRLQAAMQLDSEAALQSASWGLGQIMGENFAAAGFASVDTMVRAFVDTEDAQLSGMVSFIKANGMDGPLSNLDWANFARRYNGPNYAANNYDGLLAKFHAQFQSGAPPDLTVRAVQTYLFYHGHAVTIDGVMGPNTKAAIIAFQTSINVAPTGVIDDALITALSS
jgi:peptidoglycan hydrolase-like protein with peptidoglycan-binding domain